MKAAILALLCSVAAASAALAGEESPVIWKDNDDLPIAEPAEDPEGDYIWWDGFHNMALYPAGKLLDLGQLGRSVGRLLGIAGPVEAADVNRLDEVPDSTWFTNRHALHRLDAKALAEGPDAGHAPASEGPLSILSGKSLGMTPGFIVGDAKGDRYVVKFDAPDYPELSTGAELVCSKIVWALGWNLPEYYLFLFDPSRLTIAADATAKDPDGRKVPFTQKLLAEQLSHAYRLADGRVRAVASRMIPGTPKGPPRMLGVRPDDPNDTVRHEDRRSLRGLRTVAAFISYTDGRRGNFFDSFVRDSPDKESGGHLVHYLLDFSSGFGAGNVDYKDPKLGHEYLFDPPKVLWRLLTLGLDEPGWDHLPLTHRKLGYFESSIFDPEEWKPTYLNPIFDRATLRDRFWGAKLVTSLSERDLRIVSRAGGWSDPHVADLLADILIERRRRIARAYFDWRVINPLDRFSVRDSVLGFEDLAVASGVVDGSVARYRFRTNGSEWATSDSPRVPLEPSGGARRIEIETSHDAGERWSPPVRIVLADLAGRLQAAEVERVAR
jgi:hypothetical protein